VSLPDTTCVDFHRIPAGGLVVNRIEGTAVRVLDHGRRTEPLAMGDVLSVGDTIALERGSLVVASDVVMDGGRNGRAHTFVGDRAFRSTPSRADVPALLRQFESMGSTSVPDPFASLRPPTTPYERTVAADFARMNLDLRAALELPRETACELRAVPLFLSEETAFVAMERVDLPRIVRLMSELSRPVNPHLVPPEVVEELIDRVYG
jgi:hypothetical protein